ncbi:MAG TPA: KTSC domain-containing protein [Allosphingosinicella sp.]|nr:KTSC domain-containing protein [Allosphingosinicella sp.]
MVQVESEAILEIDYDSATATLYVRFTDGDWYSYFHVPAPVHRAFLSADSHGRYFHDHIRDRYGYREGR